MLYVVLVGPDMSFSAVAVPACAGVKAWRDALANGPEPKRGRWAYTVHHHDAGAARLAPFVDDLMHPAKRVSWKRAREIVTAVSMG